MTTSEQGCAVEGSCLFAQARVRKFVELRATTSAQMDLLMQGSGLSQSTAFMLSGLYVVTGVVPGQEGMPEGENVEE